MSITKSCIKYLTYQVNGAAIEVHKTIGPGLLESIYHRCLMHELSLRNIKFVSEVQVPIQYKQIEFGVNLRCDLLIESCMVVEIKSTEAIMPVHEAQILTYMKLARCPKGILFNFNVANLYNDGQRTFVNEYFAKLKGI